LWQGGESRRGGRLHGEGLRDGWGGGGRNWGSMLGTRGRGQTDHNKKSDYAEQASAESLFIHTDHPPKVTAYLWARCHRKANTC
jgi:hypothetical protein